MIGSLAIGGAERQLAMLATALARKGLPVRVFALESGGPLRADLQHAGVQVIDGGYDSRAPFLWKVVLLARAQMRLVANLLRWRAGVVHAFLPLAGLLAMVAGRLCGVPRLIVARRALGTHQERHSYWLTVDRVVARLAHVVTANAQAVAEDTARREGVPLTKIRVIPNGIESTRFMQQPRDRQATRLQLQLRSDDIALVCLANLIPYKGHHDLLEAFARLARERPQARLFLIGDDRGIGPALDDQANRLGIASLVMRLGHRDDVAALLGAMDIAVLASHEEGLSNAILEYLAAGLPVVATEVGGTAEILRGLPGCRLVPSRDTPALAAALLDLLPEANQEKPREARRQSVTRRFSVDVMVERHLELYGLASSPVGH